jgi:putative ABC transport system substrate-binding protein
MTRKSMIPNTWSQINHLVIINFLLLSIFINPANAKNYSKPLDQQAKSNRILISQTAEHPAFTATNKGIIAGLASYGYSIGYNLTLQRESIRANLSWGSQVAKNFVQQSPNLIIALGTMSAESFINYADNSQIKLIFSSITNPIDANLVINTSINKKNISGVSSFIEPNIYLKYLKLIQPNLTNLGIIYNRLEKNSIFMLQEFEQACDKLAINLIKQANSKTSNSPKKFIDLAFKVDAILINNDNNAFKNLNPIIKAANIAHIPVYVSDVDAIKLGALAALGPNQYEIGFQTGEMAARILDGEDINAMSTQYINNYKLYLNLAIAKQLGLEIPQHVIKDAVIINNMR